MKRYAYVNDLLEKKEEEMDINLRVSTRLLAEDSVIVSTDR
jgi:hypothetical protein